MTFGLIPKVLDAIDVVVCIRKKFAVSDARVLEL
jgi:hypothetical protein